MAASLGHFGIWTSVMVAIPGWKLYAASTNNAFRISGTQDGLRLGASPGAATPITMTCWARIVTDRNTYSCIFSIENTGGGTYNELITDVDGTTLCVFDHIGGLVGTVGTLTAGVWYKVALVLTSGAFAAYIGTEGGGAPTKVTGTLTNSSAPDYCGVGCSSSSTEWFNGRLSMLRVWTAALSDAEVAAELVSATPVRSANLYGAWLPQTVTTGTILTAVSGTDLVDGAGAGVPDYTVEAGPTL